MKDDKHFERPPSITAPFETSAKPTLAVDVARYEEYLAGSGMSDAEKQEFLEAVWSIIWNFVELGFGVHPLQEAGPEICGQNDENSEYSTHGGQDRIGSKQEQMQPREP
ncbi:hypothetical protein [Aquibaculum sediminis]|uniref:hypothetical protein n=1 Tax=Aquibaculum sediminis TaxID=3231907 RepID=UPI0034553177